MNSIPQSNFAIIRGFIYSAALLVSLIASLCSFSTTANAVAKPRVLEPAEQALPLDFSGRGYLLISLNSVEVAASFEFSMLRRRGDAYPGPENAKRKEDKDYRVSLQGLGAGYYLLELPQGWYQITRVSAPYFDLPFRLDVGSEPSWRFQIKGNRVNYAGQLLISKERSANYVQMRLKNHFATEYLEINQKLGELLSIMPLVYGGGVRDDFWADYLGVQP